MYAFLSKIIEMGAYLSPYGVKPDLECDGEDGAGNGFRYSATIMQGWRKNQEDSYKCEVQDFPDGYKYFAVFDGHGGSEVAKYLQNELHTVIKSFLNEQNDKDPELALQLGFLTCDLSIRDPAGIQELNDLVEKENQATVANIERNKRSIFAGMSSAGDGCSSIGECSSAANCSKDCVDSDSSEDMSIEETLKRSSGNENNSNHDNEDAMSVEENEAHSSNSEMKSNHENKDNSEEQMDTLKYLLDDDLENSDPEDEDFDLEDEATSSESENEDTFEDMENIEPGVHSGSTGTVLLMDSKQYYCANVGDSRCVLCRDGTAIDLSIDHKPEDPEEMKRIHAAGSVISDGRIDKSLNLSRAFGDFCYKNMSFAPFEQCVTADPSIKLLEIDDKDEFVIIASDGIWNSMSSQEVVDFIKTRLKTENDLKLICEDLCRLIVAPNTSGDGTGCDNMTCILIQFQKGKNEGCPK